MVWRRKCATRIQRAWRGYCSRRQVYDQLRRPECRIEAPVLHRRVCGRALAAVGSRMERACGDREDALDRFLESLDQSVAQCSQQLRDGFQGFEQIHGAALGITTPGHASATTPASSTTTVPRGAPSIAASATTGSSVHGEGILGVDSECWAKARRAALARGDEVDCPICFQDCELLGHGCARVELLSCSHVFHRTCILSFESFHVFEVHQCPVCRQAYHRRPWQFPAAPAVAANAALQEPSRRLFRGREGRPPRAVAATRSLIAAERPTASRQR